MRQATGPVLDLFNGALKPRALALFDTAFEPVLAHELAIVFFKLMLERQYVFGFEQRQHIGGIVRATVEDGAESRLDPFDRPNGVIMCGAALQSLLNFRQKLGVFRQLITSVPVEQARNALIEFLLLLCVEIKVIVGAPCKYDVGLVVAYA